MTLRPVSPVFVNGLFQPDRDALVELLGSLRPTDWDRPTVCFGWSVKDVAIHLVGGDLSNIAGRRDGAWLEPIQGEAEGEFVNRINREWVEAARRLSPRLIVELLAWTGPRLFKHLELLDPLSMGGPVSWAGPGPAPVWLDVAREYTERWVHQQQIRDAAGRPGQTEPRFVTPVIATFVHAVPVVLAGAKATVGDIVAVTVEGDAGGEWAVVYEREADAWLLREGRADAVVASVRMDADTTWRLLTLGLPEREALERVHLEGDAELGARVLQAVAIIA